MTKVLSLLVTLLFVSSCIVQISENDYRNLTSLQRQRIKDFDPSKMEHNTNIPDSLILYEINENDVKSSHPFKQHVSFLAFRSNVVQQEFHMFRRDLGCDPMTQIENMRTTILCIGFNELICAIKHLLPSCPQ